jgi:hypothetical protein
MGEVADVIGGLGQILDPLSLCGLSGDGKDGNAGCHEQREKSGMYAANACHRFLLYEFGLRKVPIGGENAADWGLRFPTLSAERRGKNGAPSKNKMK